MKKILSQITLLLKVGVLLSLITGCQSPESSHPERKVRVLQVQSQDFYPTLMFPGRSRPAKSVNMSFRVSGPLINLPIIVGQEVNKGALLAQIDPRDFILQVQNIEGNIQQMDASIRLAESEFQRFNNIFQRDPGAVSAIIVEQKREAVNNLLGQLRSVQANLNIAKQAVEDTSLRAPFNCTVVGVFVDNFQFISAAQPVARVVSTEEIEVLIDVPDRIISSIRGARNIQVQFDAVPGIRFTATIEEIGTEASQTTRTFPVTLLVVPPEGTYLFPGMTGTAILEQSISHAKEESTFKLPLSALFNHDGQTSAVWATTPSTWQISAKPVKIVTLSHQYAIVTGLTNDDWIVVSGVNFLTDKQLISPLAVRIDETGEIFQLPDRPTPNQDGSDKL